MDKWDLYYQVALSQVEGQDHRYRPFTSRMAAVLSVGSGLLGVAMFILHNADGLSGGLAWCLWIPLALCVNLVRLRVSLWA